jgi:hypothetical protein
VSHTAIITQAKVGTGYLVTCPHGCKLGTSARQGTREGAERRVALHQAATTPLVRCIPHSMTGPGHDACQRPIDAELFARTAPAWNCVSHPGEGPHYASAGDCVWCGMTREQIAAEWESARPERLSG